MTFQDIYLEVDSNRENRLQGKFNSIPWNLPRLTKEVLFPGWVKGKYYLITAASGIGKSKFTKWLVIISNYIKWIESNKSFNVKIFWFALEEPIKKLKFEFISCFIYYRYGKIVTPEMMQSLGEYTVTPEIVKWIKEFEGSEFEKFVSQKIEIIDSIYNPTGIKKHIENFFNSPEIGEMEYEEREGKKYAVRYHHKKDTYYFIVVDHLSLLHNETIGGTLMSERQTIQFFSNQYVLNIFCKRYDMIPVMIQQQVSEGEKLVFSKGVIVEEKLEPTKADLGDCKTTQRDADVIIGVFAPHMYNLVSHRGYDIEILQDNYRSIRFLKDRLSGFSGRLGLYFSRGVFHFEELPPVVEMSNAGKKHYEHFIEKTKNENKF